MFNLGQQLELKGNLKNMCTSVSSSPVLHKGQVKLFPILIFLLLSIFLVLSLSASNNHAKNFSFGQSFDFHVHKKGAGGVMFRKQ
jgi:ATP-dependent Zn protease